MEFSKELIGIIAIMLAQFKLIFDIRVTKVELKNIVRRLDKSNNRIGKAEDWQMNHIIKGHKK